MRTQARDGSGSEPSILLAHISQPLAVVMPSAVATPPSREWGGEGEENGGGKRDTWCGPTVCWGHARSSSGMLSYSDL